MLPAFPPTLMIPLLLQGTPVVRPPSFAAGCEENQRVELAVVPEVAAREICVSPGIMTGFLFDTSAELELQDEVRFVGVLRGRNGISFVPPRDMEPGERLRLMAYVGDGESRQLVAFVLVAHRGQATRQVEVYRDRRTPESLQQEVDQERARNQKLLEENHRLRMRIERARGLLGLYVSGGLSAKGVAGRDVDLRNGQHSDDAIRAERCITYRAVNSVGISLWLKNSGTEPWRVATISVATVKGEELEEVMVSQDDAIPPGMGGGVFVEVDSKDRDVSEGLSLILRDENARSISISRVTFP